MADLSATVKRYVPQSVRVWKYRRHQRALHRGWRTRDIAECYVAEHGLVVQHGPLAGIRFPAEALSWEQCELVPTLRGSYEREIHPYLEAPGELFVDIGCAEGSYLVGMAAKGLRAVGFEIDRVRRRRARRLAALNGLADRVEVRGEFNPDGLDFDNSLILCDIEGAETVVIPAHAERFRNARVIVELHNGSEDIVIPALAPTHEVTIVNFTQRLGLDDEHRGAEQAWAIFEPRPGAD